MEQYLLYILPLGTFIFPTRTKGLHVTNKKLTLSLLYLVMVGTAIPDFYDRVLQ